MQQRSFDPAILRALGERAVCVRLVDGSEFEGVFRLELLSEQSISVFLQRPLGPLGDGVTIYLDSIVSISPL
jgi:hypothetical protein